MPKEIYTKKGLDVANAVKRQFGDPDGRQITDNDIREWINGAQQEIVSQNPILKGALQNDITAGQDLYEYPSDNIQYIESVHYDGVPLESYTFQDAQTYLLANRASAQGDPELWYERDGSLYLYPKPDKNLTGGLRLFFIRRPADLAALTELLGVPDRYFQRVVDLVLARAYQLDENWEAAQYKQTEFFSGMNLLANQENTTQQNTYPTISVRPEDQ